jgi:hypothetical protein
MAGYSANPLFKKLGLKEGQAIKLVNAPSHYCELIGEMIGSIQIWDDAVADLDLIHFFTNSKQELQDTLPKQMTEIKKSGSIWVSWYKKSAGKPTELSEDLIRETALAAGLVDVKVCAIDDDWSALKLVYRLKYR